MEITQPFDRFTAKVLNKNVFENGGFNGDKAKCAVDIKNLCKSYQYGVPVVHDFCMNVQKGTIYGLLGSSGCGKTTVISCIVGLAKWDSGDIQVLGKNVGEKNCAGRSVGYMPQDLALYSLLSIKEVVQFYGRIYGMSSKNLRERLQFLNTLLELPTDFIRIGDLSGGQKRRASLALALIHSPQLLVLDEPTVGLDPVLRMRIWDYLFQLVNSAGITIIITTHYTEEVRYSHRIGVMRKGTLIFEDSPKKLLNSYNCDLLEVAVLRLSKDDEILSESKSAISKIPAKSDNKIVFKSKWKEYMASGSVVYSDLSELLVNAFFHKNAEFDLEVNQPWELDVKKNRLISSTNPSSRNNNIVESFQKVYGLSTIFILNTFRSRVFLAAALLILALQGALMMLVIGTKPKNLPFGIVNLEMTNWTSECNSPVYLTNSCRMSGLSCRFLKALQEDEIFALTAYNNKEDALAKVYLGKSWGYLEIPPNYSQNAYNFALEKHFASNETLQGSSISVRVDYSEYTAAFFMLKHLYGVYLEYIKTTGEMCGVNGQELTIPLNFRQPVYGNNHDNFTDFVLPGAIVGSIISIIAAMSAVNLISDRNQGTFSRARVAGVSLFDIIISNFIHLGVVLLCQLIILGAMLYLFFDFPILGSVWLCIFLCMLTGSCAVVLGIFIGTVCRHEADALIICSYMSIALGLYGGVFWPTESMAAVYQQIANLVPVSLPAFSLRSIIIRGLGITSPLVWWGFVSLVIWSSILLICSVIGYQYFCK